MARRRGGGNEAGERCRGRTILEPDNRSQTDAADVSPTGARADCPAAWARRYGPLALIGVAALLAVAFDLHKTLAWDWLAREWARVEFFVAHHPVAAVSAYVAVYAVATGVGLPGALVLTVAGGLMFGPLVGGTAALVAATAGGTLIFLATRSAFGSVMARRAGSLAARLSDEFRRDAFHYLLFLRLAPAFPFYLVNLVPALCEVRLTTFVIASILGMAPATFAFAFIGAGLDHVIERHASALAACKERQEGPCDIAFDAGALVSPQVIAGLVALAVLALVPIVVRRLRARRNAADAGRVAP